jgi:hypothetical protein
VRWLIGRRRPDRLVEPRRLRPQWTTASRQLGPAGWLAVSLDASSSYKTIAVERVPRATICLDPFHVIGWAGEVVDAPAP